MSTTTLRVLTWNVFKLGGRVPPERVARAVVELEPDLVGLQEVFNTRLAVLGFSARNARKLLSEALGAAGFATFWHPASGPGPFRFLVGGRFRDGLLLAARESRFELDPERGVFSKLLDRRRFDRRIVQGATLRLRGEGERRLAFLNTHLAVGASDAAQARRRVEVEELLRTVRSLEAEHSPLATLLVGDFNARAESAEIQRLRVADDLNIRFLDTWREANLDVAEEPTLDVGNTIVRRRPERNRPEASERIDFVLLHTPEQKGGRVVAAPRSEIVFRERDAETGENLSDHYGVLTQLEIVG